MGYYSDVKLLVSKEGYRELKEYVVKEGLKFKKPEDEYDYNMIRIADSIKTDGDQVLISWDSIKWYDGYYHDVDIIIHGIEHLSAEGYSYRFYRVGESYDDMEVAEHDGDLDQDLDYLDVVRAIDDSRFSSYEISWDAFDESNLKKKEGEE